MKLEYDNLIETESTDHLYEAWSDYRTELTSYIISSIEGFHIKRKLVANRGIRIPGTYNIKRIVEEYGDSKPVLAIWGAGGCNDIDIIRLAKYFRLVLIDRDISVLNRTKKRFGLGNECICVDMHFWDISDDEYRAFEELLIKGADADEIEKYIDMLVLGMSTLNYTELPKFDYSVVVGIGSQLNSRFAALSYIYDRGIDVFEILKGMNEIAINRMMDAIYKTTGQMVILGYEIKSSDDAGELKDISKYINENIEMLAAKQSVRLDDRLTSVDIAGNDELVRTILEYMYVDSKLIYFDSRTFLWPFIKEKNYLVGLICMEVNVV